MDARVYEGVIRNVLAPFFFFFIDAATTEIYTLSLTTLFRSVLTNPPYGIWWTPPDAGELWACETSGGKLESQRDRKSTRLNSSHVKISYAVFCLKKKIQPP